MTLDLLHDLFAHGLVVEASAGTGKTYSVAAIVTRELALNEDRRIGKILITTFTRNAAAELRDRVRRRLVETVGKLSGVLDAADDPLAEHLLDGTPTDIADRIRRLDRSLVEFDSATISTIHGVCSRVLRAAGIDLGSVIDSDEQTRIIEEVVNDLVVSHAHLEPRLDQARLMALVKAMIDDPLLEFWSDPALHATHGKQLETLERLLEECVRRVHTAMNSAPSHADLLRLAREIVEDDTRGDLLAVLRERFQLTIVDEAQDTDRQQWRFFKKLFPGGDGRALVTVGDPKQAIYGFRGADVRAYVDYANTSSLHRTLDTNRRSDQPLLDVLNAAFVGKEFGEGIAYHAVHAPAGRQARGISGMQGSVEFLDLGIATSQQALREPVLDKVIELLESGTLATGRDTGATSRPVEPRDICVLVRSGSVGKLIQQTLLRAGIPAVTGGTSSVMHSAAAIDFRALLEALERPSDVGRVRRAAATVFFGHVLTSVGALTDDVLERVQDGLMAFGSTLANKGLAALGAAIEADETIMSRLAAGPQGERNVTDFLHMIEVMDAEGPRRGCTPEQALTVFSRLDAMDDKNEIVSRRVESDADAVTILTIHAAKGLEFPCVIVADLWKESRGASQAPAVFYDRDNARKIDIGFGIAMPSDHARSIRGAAEQDEARRLLYVAVTRPEHYLAVLVARGKPSKNGPALPSVLEETMTLPATLATPGTRTTLLHALAHAGGTSGPLVLAPAPAVVQTYRRMSFSSLTAGRAHHRSDVLQNEVRGGFDEPATTGTITPPPSSTPALARMPVVDLPAGVAVGSLIHEIFEQIDTSREPLADEVRRVVVERATSGRLKHCHDALVTIITESLKTPLGGPFGALTLGSVQPEDRLPEMDFEMGLASLADGVTASAIGRVLVDMLPGDDPLSEYAKTLAGPSFNLPLGGLLTGSIDAVLRLSSRTHERPRLLLVDYKSNNLHGSGMSDPMEAYRPDRLVGAMAEHDYPLQAILYGTATYRMLRWRLPHVDPDDCIAGVAYAFIRGMKGPETPVDERGHRYGVFAWTPPPGLWARLSDLLETPVTAGVLP